jgi:hypothetical protein
MIGYGYRPDVDGAELLGEVETFLSRFVAYPSEHACVAHALWIAHAHLIDAWESTPRLAFLSPEPGSGKSRALEVTEPLVPRPVHAVNTSPAYLFRKVSDDAGPPTILYDEIDTVFGPKAKDNEDIRGMLNAGHRKGAVAGRCVVRGKIVETEELPAYCAVALAGLNDLPDTIMTRSVVVRMRRRAPGEHIEAWRRRVNVPQAEPLYEQLAAWAEAVAEHVTGAWPTMPPEVQDRDADVWEALLAVADVAGGDWPHRARAAAVALVASSKDRAPSLGVLLLADVRTAFADAVTDRLSTSDLLDALHKLPESPWANLRGKELDARGLARRLTGYEIRSAQVWIGGKNVRGYDATSFADAWTRYLPDDEPLAPDANARNARNARDEHQNEPVLAGLADLADASPQPRRTFDAAPDADACPTCGKPTARSRAGHQSLCLECTRDEIAAARKETA